MGLAFQETDGGQEAVLKLMEVVDAMDLRLPT